MSNMVVEVSFMAGTDITTAVQEAIDKCILWDVGYIKFNFNGVRVNVTRHSNINLVKEGWSEVYKSKKDYWIISSTSNIIV